MEKKVKENSKFDHLKTYIIVILRTTRKSKAVPYWIPNGNFLISYFKLKASILEGLAVSCQKWDQQVNWSRFLKAQTSKRGPSSYYWTHAFSSRGCPFPFPFPFPFYSTHITPSFPPYHVHGRKTCMTYPFNSSISRIQMEVCEIFGWWRSQKNL